MQANKGLIWFLALAFGISWAIAAVGHLAGAGDSPIAMLLISSAFMWGPGIAALMVRKWLAPDTWESVGMGKTSTYNWGWTVAAWAFPVVILGVHVGVIAFLGNQMHLQGFGTIDVSKEGIIAQVKTMMEAAGQNPALALAQFDRPLWQILLMNIGGGLIAGASINLLFALGEELGWRGYMLHITRQWGFWKSNTVIGVVWGLWHAPLILQGHNYPAHPVAGVFVMVGFTLSLSFLMAYFREKSGNVFSAAAFHGTLNGIAGAMALFIQNGAEFWGSAVGLSAMIAGVICTLVVFMVDRKFWRSMALVSNEILTEKA